MKHFCSFSEAIREGAKLRPQGVRLREDRVDKNTSCAIEAGIEAIGADFEWNDQIALCEIFPYLYTKASIPLNHETYDDLFSICYMLNDAGWTREQVADWLESEEEKLGFVTLTEPESQRSESPELAEVTV
jgi:hypothetical protein